MMTIPQFYFHWTHKVEMLRRATAMCIICQWMAVLD